MKAILCNGFGNEDVLQLGEIPSPKPGPRELRIEVRASGVNRADILQRRGLYPPPDGTSDLLGLEISGRVAELGKDVRGFEVGEKVMALLAGGGYAAKVVVNEGCVMRIPEGISEIDAAGIPETFITAFLNLFELGGLRKGKTALIHGGSGGVGTSSIQLARELGAQVLVTAGSDDRCRKARELGADLAINYKSQDWVTAIQEFADGVDVVLDCIGAAYLEKNLKVLRTGGRLVIIGLMGGSTTEINLGTLLMRRISLIGSTLRSRSLEEKAELMSAFEKNFGEAMAEGQIKPLIDRVLPFEEVAVAHRLLTEGKIFGKILLTP